MPHLIEIQCFPCISYFKLLSEDTYVKFDTYEIFKKSSFRNRFVIAGANGLINLTVPIAGGREQKRIITDIEIDSATNWPEQHWRSITSAYRKAPFFEFYAEDIKKMLFNTEKNLLRFNLFIITSLCKALAINVLFDFSDSNDFDGPREMIDFLDCRNRFLPSNFQQMGEDWQPRYSQVFEDRLGFQPNLSILDLLFCEGANSKYLLERS